ncbi:Salutaridinol 7-O-acetyltransferase [Acorus gramineus]|uniref:Salutaridinol 7-O-acetyltransferase n=1 Tax=Acorus gramineus TaxID=55184 RepID=A0AAV8ZWX6_ACOGR|nr:Salutaridinol 7-O-acetyltransferase [Acorus gramineus]
MEIEILSRETIRPTSPTQPHLRWHQLSALDQLAPQVTFDLVLFYPINGGDQSPPAHRETVLKTSLSRLLTSFYPLAGRLLLHLQLTHFSCASSALGICFSHQIGDGSSWALLLKAWSASAHLGVVSPQLTPRFNAASIFPPAFSGAAGYGFYEADFGWGRPRRLGLVNHNTGEQVVFVGTASGEGVEVWVWLEEEVMGRFERDPEIVGLVSHVDHHHSCL